MRTRMDEVTDKIKIFENKLDNVLTATLIGLIVLFSVGTAVLGCNAKDVLDTLLVFILYLISSAVFGLVMFGVVLKVATSHYIGVTYKTTNAVSAWKLDESLQAFIYINIVPSYNRMYIQVQDKTTFVEGVRKIKVDKRGYDKIAFLISINSFKELLELGEPCVSMLEEVEYLTQEDTNKILIADLKLDEDADN